MRSGITTERTAVGEKKSPVSDSQDLRGERLQLLFEGKYTKARNLHLFKLAN